MVTLELHGVDLADSDAGDPHLVTGLEAAGLGEGSVVGVPAADEGQVADVEGQGQQGDERDDADRPDRDRVAFAEWLAHPR